jgi:histidinol-phosphate aminotransferase
MNQRFASPLKPKPKLASIGYYMVGISELPGFERIIKLSSNESPLGPSPKAVAAATKAMSEAHRYPELGLQALPEAIAARFNLDPAMIAFGPGSDEILLRLVNIFSGPGDEMIHSANAYMQFPIYALRAGSQPVAAADNDLRHSVEHILACVTERTSIVVIANPDNPSGTYLPGSQVRRLREALREDILLIVDAAYDEYATASDYESAVNLVADYRNIVVTRTFSKIFCLAGLRLGWCYAPREVIDLMERVGPSFPTNIAAQAAGTAAVLDKSHTDAVLRHNAKWIGKFRKSLGDMGLKAYPSQTNFVLVQFPPGSAKTAQGADDFLKSHGIVARKFALDAFSDKLRFTIGLDEEMQKATEILALYMGSA